MDKIIEGVGSIKLDEPISSEYQDKKWRKDQEWYKTGKSNECEIYQRNQVIKITKTTCAKTKIRINTNTLIMEKCINPLTKDDGFEWTEDFDGISTVNKINIYYNLKMVCSKGGAQTRTLREVYHFIKAQLDYQVKYNLTGKK